MCMYRRYNNNYHNNNKNDSNNISTVILKPPENLRRCLTSRWRTSPPDESKPPAEPGVDPTLKVRSTQQFAAKRGLGFRVQG